VGGFAPACLDEDMLHFWIAWWNIREGFFISVGGTC